MTIRSLFLASTLLATLSAPAIAQRALPTAVTPDPAVAAIRDKALQDDVAYDIVSGLTTEIGPRPDGSPAEERARQWALVKLNVTVVWKSL